MSEDLTSCPHCKKTEWTPIPDSLAECCSCGFVRVGEDGNYTRGASIQKWLNDTVFKDIPIDNPHER